MLELSLRTCKSSYSLHNCWSCHNILIKLILVYCCCVLFSICSSFIVPQSLRNCSLSLGILLLLFTYLQGRAVRLNPTWCPPHPCTATDKSFILTSTQGLLCGQQQQARSAWGFLYLVLLKEKKDTTKDNMVNYEKHSNSMILSNVTFLSFLPFFCFLDLLCLPLPFLLCVPPLFCLFLSSCAIRPYLCMTQLKWSR